MRTVKVAAYRQETDRLFRVANVDYHACMRVVEVERWREVANRLLVEAEGLHCPRAKEYDREQFAAAVAAVQSRLAQSVERIETLKQPKGQVAKNVIWWPKPIRH